MACGVALALMGCAAPSPDPEAAEGRARVVALGTSISELGDVVDAEEARRAAHSLVGRSDALVAEYRLVRPSLFHNLLVNLGLRERGLCCHFAEDLIADLLALELRTLEVHWVVARHGSRFREHSSVLLVPIGGVFADGLVVDAWRRGGDLFWARVSEDRYPWVLHPMSGDWEDLHCI